MDLYVQLYVVGDGEKGALYSKNNDNESISLYKPFKKDKKIAWLCQGTLNYILAKKCEFLFSS